MIRFLITVISLNFIACLPPPPNNPNTEYTISKRDTEEKIMSVTFIKVLSCNFHPGQALFMSELGNDEDPSPDEGNKRILFEKRAVDHCLKSILSMPCPPFPPNTEQAIGSMIFNVVSNRSLNCFFEEIKFRKFQKPLSGSFW